MLSFITDDLDRDMDALRRRGAVAEMFGERAAWFSDSEENIMEIEEPSPGRLEQSTKMRASIAGRP